MLGLDHCTPSVQAMFLFNFYQKKYFVSQPEADLFENSVSQIVSQLFKIQVRSQIVSYKNIIDGLTTLKMQKELIQAFPEMINEDGSDKRKCIMYAQTARYNP